MAIWCLLRMRAFCSISRTRASLRYAANAVSLNMLPTESKSVETAMLSQCRTPASSWLMAARRAISTQNRPRSWVEITWACRPDHPPSSKTRGSSRTAAVNSLRALS